MANNNNNDERIRTSSSSTTPSGDGLLGSDAPPHQAQDLVAHSSMLDGYGGAAYQSTRPVADSPGEPFHWDQVDQLDQLNAEMCVKPLDRKSYPRPGVAMVPRLIPSITMPLKI